MSTDLYNIDCVDLMSLFLDNDSIDSIVTDPPYELTNARPGGRSEATRGAVMGGFMGMKWDASGIAHNVDMWREAYRVLKPGGYLLAFGGSRTYHRLACAIEDAGFDIRDQIMWIYGSGFPKSHNGAWGGTALKPAHEPIVVARKPLIGTVEANWLAYGTGALNIDGCRVQPTGESRERDGETSQDRRYTAAGGTNFAATPGVRGGDPAGRWPANIIHDGSDEVLAAFPAAQGQQGRAKDDGSAQGNKIYGALRHGTRNPEPRQESDTSAARFFMTCKSSYNDGLWLDLNLPSENAITAEPNLFQQKQAVVFALALAVNSVLPAELCADVSLSAQPTTNATPSELRRISEAVTQTIQITGSRFWRESQPAKLSLSHNLVSIAADLAPTGITTITANHWKSDGSAEPVTLSITLNSLEAGAKVSEPSTYNRRFIYCAKASRKDRNEGLEGFETRQSGIGDDRPSGSSWERRAPEKNPNHPRANTHPTVKPTDLMAYLCRLVTPAGGVILDPFMGSGSTGKAAIREGFRFIGAELDPDYFNIASARIASEQAKVGA